METFESARDTYMFMIVFLIGAIGPMMFAFMMWYLDTRGRE
jgi:hypothetical protein